MNPTSASFRQILNAALGEALNPSAPSKNGESIESVKTLNQIPLTNPTDFSLSTPIPLSKAYPKRSLKVPPPPPPAPPHPEEPGILTEKLSVEGAMHLRLILGRHVNPNEKITLKDIKRAYRQKAKELHPDHHPEASGPQLKQLNEAFGQLKESYRKFQIEVKELLKSS